ncbi:MAG: hypothetical protein M9888_06060 [Chitinophagales bacterium]|nr:hypothetical protein [Chitinophagales bacterium]
MIWLLLITGAIYLFYLTLSLSNIDGERGFNKYERKIYNMGSSIVSKYDSDIENYSREKIINFAKVLFINDIELQKISFEEVIIHHNMKEYLLDNDSLSSHYESTILSLIDSLWVNFKYIMLSILLMGLCIGVFYRRSFFIKLILGLFACVSLILLLNLFSEINIRFASVFLLLIFCLLMNYLINAKAIIVLWLIGFIGILNYGSFRKDIYPDLLKIHKAHTSLIDLRNKLSEDGLSLYLGSINVSYAYPIKLFDRDKTVWKYLDASNMNNNSVFQKIFIDEFGEDWGRIDKRMMQIVEECGLIAMDEMYKKLFERYLELIYNMHLNFVLINHIPQSDINIYQVTIVE